MTTTSENFLAGVKAYLKIQFSDDDYDDDTLEGALLVELAAQSRVVQPRYLADLASDSGMVLVPDLAQALYRRVARNLAMRALPLGMTEGENGSSFVGAKDPEVSRLEKPFRKRVTG